MNPQADPFHEPYNRDDIAYGDSPSAALAAYLKQVDVAGKALDLGAGAGRDTIALAIAGYDVTAVDLSKRGLDRVVERAAAAGVIQQVTPVLSDVRDLEIPAASYGAIVATTVLDHIDASDAKPVWDRMTSGLTAKGLLFVEVHTTEDPGCDRLPGSESTAPVSETTASVINYFEPNLLARWATDPASELRILRYEERLEWDYTHGHEHLHGKAILLAVKQGSHPPWYGQPAAFPKRGSTD